MWRWSSFAFKWTACPGCCLLCHPLCASCSTRRCLHPPCLHHPVLPSLRRAHGALCLLQHALTAARFIACLVHCQQHPALPTFCTARCQPCALPVLCPAPPAAPHNLLLCALHCRCRVPPAAPCSACMAHRLVHCILSMVLCAAAALCIAHSTMHHLPSYPALPAATWTTCSTVQCLFSAPPYPALLRPALCTVGSSAPPAVSHLACTPCCLQLALPTGDCTTCRAMHAMLCVLPGASRTTCSIPYCLCDVYLLFCALPAVPWTVFTVHCVP